MGMVGASYGGGIQLVTAAIDCRVDAIVPQIAWHSLGTEPLQGADGRRADGATSSTPRPPATPLDPHITSAHHAGNTTGVIEPADDAVVPRPGPGRPREQDHRAHAVRAGNDRHAVHARRSGRPTTTSCTANGVPTAMLWMCSGHGVCLTNPGDQKLAGPGGARLARPVREERHEGQGRRAVRVRRPERRRVHRRPSTRCPPSTPIVADGTRHAHARRRRRRRARRTRPGNAGALGTASRSRSPRRRRRTR